MGVMRYEDSNIKVEFSPMAFIDKIDIPKQNDETENMDELLFMSGSNPRK